MAYRTLGWTLLLASLLGLAGAGCNKETPVNSGEFEIQLLLPETTDNSDYKEKGPDDHWVFTRPTQLSVGGKDIDEVSERKRTLQVEPEKGKRSVTVVYSYWPKSYTNRVRTKVVALEMGKRVEADLSKEDPVNPDKIFPVYYPTPHSLLKPMCEMGKVGKNDIVSRISPPRKASASTSVKS